MNRSLLLTLLLLAPSAARADGVAPIVTALSVSSSTPGLPGDVVSYRIRYVALPDNTGSLEAMQGYLTAYIPANTRVIGVKLLAADGTTTVPRQPGLALDAASGGSIAQAHADTGVFITAHPALARMPADDLLRLTNGTPVSPRQGSKIAPIVGASPTDIRSHNAWDTAQVQAYGVTGGAPPANQGSPVAGSGTFYQLSAGNASSPWSRVLSPGAVVGFDPPGPIAAVRRTVQPLFPGRLETLEVPGPALPMVDLSPLAPAPATAVRIALGALRVGQGGVAEVFLQVAATPVDVACAEIFGADSSKRSPEVAGIGPETGWATFVPSPACAFLDLLFDLDVDRDLATAGTPVTWTLHGKNLSTASQTNVQVYVGYDASRGTVTSAAPAGHAPAGCPAALGVGLTCLRWSLGTLAASAEYTHTVGWLPASGTGAVTNTLRALYVSDQRPAGHTAEDVTILVPTPVIGATVAPTLAQVEAGSFTPVQGHLMNTGTAAATVRQVDVAAPEGFAIRNISVGGAVLCPGTFTTTATCGVLAQAISAGGTLAVSYEVAPPAETPPGLHPTHLAVWVSTPAYGGEVESAFTDAALVPVGAPRSAAPAIACGTRFDASATQISGTSTEPNGTTVRVYFDGIVRGEALVASKKWKLSGYGSTFGALYAGLELRATAQAPGGLESDLSPACMVAPARRTR
jgi:hypothetical protein